MVEERKEGEGGAENERGRSQKREGRRRQTRRRQKDKKDEGRGEKDHVLVRFNCEPTDPADPTTRFCCFLQFGSISVL